MSVSLDIQKPQDSAAVSHVDVIVVGAGPYGLSSAAHLQAKGLKVAVFGKPLSLWRENMPQGMLLRSFWWASNLSDPQKKYTLERYFALHHMQAPVPLSAETFIDYALWFQRNCVPNVDETFVSSIEHGQDRFKVTLQDGRIVYAQSVVMAPGLAYYVFRPVQYASLSPRFVSHTADHCSLNQFSGKHVTIIGGGQSALEGAALLHEQGAQVEVIARRSIQWLKDEIVENRSLYQRLRHPKAGIAPGWFNWLIEHVPYGFQKLSRSTKDRLLRGRGSYGPAGSAWLKGRVLGKVKVHENCNVEHVRESDQKVVLRLSDSTTIQTEHVMLATGYRVNIWQLPMLSSELLSRIHTYYNAPVLTAQFESSVPGLYFVGISSVLSFGPFYRFVVGVDATARRIAGAVARKTTSLT